jgi:hypothetical protein
LDAIQNQLEVLRRNRERAIANNDKKNAKKYNDVIGLFTEAIEKLKEKE